MSVRTALRWVRHYAVEPWGNREAGIRTGLLAKTNVSDPDKIAAEDFIVSLPTKQEEKEREEWEERVAAFHSWSRNGKG